MLAAINQTITKIKAQQQQAKRNREILKRNEAESQTLTLLTGHERERYVMLLQHIAYDTAVMNDVNQPYEKRLASKGRLNGNVVLRDQVEAATRQYVVVPAKQTGMAGMVAGFMSKGGKKKDAPPPPPLVSPFAKRRPQPQPRRKPPQDKKTKSAKQTDLLIPDRESRSP